MGYKILTIDDEPMVRMVISDYLASQGHEVDVPSVETSDGATAASENALTGGYDLILLDLKVPLIDTLQLIERIRGTGADIPIVIVAGFIPPELRTHLENLDAIWFLEKPFQLASLLSVVEQVMSCTG